MKTLKTVILSILLALLAGCNDNATSEEETAQRSGPTPSVAAEYQPPRPPAL